MNIIFTGGRDYADDAMVSDLIEALNPNKVFVGDCPTGADRSVREACEELKIRCSIFEANWDQHGKAAGPIRNKAMIEIARGEIDDPIVIAFPGGKGTEDCVRQGKARNLIVMRVEP